MEKMFNVWPLVRAIEQMDAQLDGLLPGAQRRSLLEQYLGLHDRLAEVMASEPAVDSSGSEGDPGPAHSVPDGKESSCGPAERASQTAGLTGEIGTSPRIKSESPGGTASPQVALLSNGRYGVVMTAAGSGCSTWGGMDVTRWREDATRDCWGQFCYVRDTTEGTVRSAGYQPLCRAADENEVAFHADRVQFWRRDGDTETRLAVCVAPDRDAEIRLVTVVNHGARQREFELTSYAEVCLNHRRADQAHPAFAKLFLETEFVPASGALLARRRPRGADQKPLWAVHGSAVRGSEPGAPEYETDRARFLGR